MMEHLYSCSAATPRQRVWRVLWCLLCAAGLSGCGAVGMVDKGLELVGLKKPDPPAGMDGAELPKLPLVRQVTLRIHAGQVLNTDAGGRPLSLITRVYRLRSTTQFSQATYAMFASTGAERPAFSDDVVSMKEIVLTPGQKYEVVETLSNDATHLAVVALFRAPDPQRWRFVFDGKAASKSGITVGAHGCALSVAEGVPVDVPPETLRLAGVQCH